MVFSREWRVNPRFSNRNTTQTELTATQGHVETSFLGRYACSVLGENAPNSISRWRASRATEQLQRDFSDPDFDDSTWTAITVPSHWQSNPEFADYDGTLLYRADLDVEELEPGMRRWLRFNGLCYTGDVFLDGAYIGQTEGYFTHHRLEVSDIVNEPGTYVLAVEVGAPKSGPGEDKPDITGWLTEGPGLPISWNPAGIWRPATIVDTGPVAIRHFRALCIEADSAHAVVHLRAVLLATDTAEVEITTSVAGVTDRTVHQVAAGENRVEWEITVKNPELWWPIGRGEQTLFDLDVTARINGQRTDHKHRRIGFRSTSMRDFIFRVNNQRTYLSGVNLAPLSTELGEMTKPEIRHEVEQIAHAGFNMVRIRGHVTRQEFIHACDEIGILVWQDLPLVGTYSRSVTEKVEQQARDMVDLLSHHPSIIAWGGHLQPHTSNPRSTAARDIRQQQIPSWNRTVLDRAVKRTLENDDPSRPVIAHSDVAPHVPQLSGSDMGLYFGWFGTDATELVEYAATLPRLVRFVSDMGTQALPDPTIVDLDAALDIHGAESGVSRAVIPPTTYEDVASWSAATRTYQGEVLKTTIETLRVLKYQPNGGFCAGIWRAASPGLTRGLLDANGTARPALTAAQNALQRILPILYPATNNLASRSTSLLALHVANDRVDDVPVKIAATIHDQRGTATRWWSGVLSSDSVEFIGDVAVRGGRIGDEMTVAIVVTDPANGVVLATNSYSFVAS